MIREYVRSSKLKWKAVFFEPFENSFARTLSMIRLAHEPDSFRPRYVGFRPLPRPKVRRNDALSPWRWEGATAHFVKETIECLADRKSGQSLRVLWSDAAAHRIVASKEMVESAAEASGWVEIRAT